ncbi:MAG TPA: hypothetical protein ENK77_01630 [Epsilonproteobacteria bacterium]|nr:hypothetical protein [Campylobacterota bacterium]HHH37298.1 hypothetical protein [Campylobacterota bacterium]
MKTKATINRSFQEKTRYVSGNAGDKKILICEVKLSARRLNRDVLTQKSIKLLKKYEGYSVEYGLLSLEDIEGF